MEKGRAELAELRFNDQGLIPAVIQDSRSGEVLMVAYMNREALQKTLSTGLTHFWSRSRKTLWQKGETSGHIQQVEEIAYDCDADTLLVKVRQQGVACHTGARSCFYRTLFRKDGEGEEKRSGDASILEAIARVIAERRQSGGERSYVYTLFQQGQDRLLKKLGEEATEVVIGSKNGKAQEVIYEMADLWFHSLLVLAWHHLGPQEVFAELERRFGRSGIEEREQRGKGE
ncbi:MAG: bifunctional phosphoribosyl-AMP cyclohydrolase/phosphoribosyl-ATP diphosphatase HisIE [Nitrospinota bacterium]|nr:MAG: bifunctional phosphoribosyl-AMP cyclohydrolase/phosphoribosyl-ATP diphosphatase HisIE [Nitrospinota bacterium]